MICPVLSAMKSSRNLFFWQALTVSVKPVWRLSGNPKDVENVRTSSLDPIQSAGGDLQRKSLLLTYIWRIYVRVSQLGEDRENPSAVCITQNSSSTVRMTDNSYVWCVEIQSPIKPTNLLPLVKQHFSERLEVLLLNKCSCIGINSMQHIGLDVESFLKLTFAHIWLLCCSFPTTRCHHVLYLIDLLYICLPLKQPSCFAESIYCKAIIHFYGVFFLVMCSY